MRTSTLAHVCAGLAASALLLVAACGDDEDAASDPPPTATASAAATEAAATSAPTDEPSSGVLDRLLELSWGFEQVAVWGRDPGGVRFEAPNGLTIDAAGNVYATEFRGGHVRKFSPDGELLLEAAGAGAEPGMLANPIGVAVDAEGTIYVSEAGVSRVSRFAPDGTFLSLWDSSGSEPGQFRSAMGIAVSAAFEVFVADFGNHRVQVFDREGPFLRSWGGFGAEPGQLDNPIGLQLGPAGGVWVIDSANERLQVFTQQGELLRVFDDVGPGPQIVSLNAAGEFYVSSPWAQGRIRRFSPDGELLGYLGHSVTLEELAAMTNGGGAARHRAVDAGQAARHGDARERRGLRGGHRQRDRARVRAGGRVAARRAQAASDSRYHSMRAARPSGPPRSAITAASGSSGSKS